MPNRSKNIFIKGARIWSPHLEKPRTFHWGLSRYEATVSIPKTSEEYARFVEVVESLVGPEKICFYADGDVVRDLEGQDVFVFSFRGAEQPVCEPGPDIRSGSAVNVLLEIKSIASDCARIAEVTLIFVQKTEDPPD